jgi:hypothetical protein
MLGRERRDGDRDLVLGRDSRHSFTLTVKAPARGDREAEELMVDKVTTIPRSKLATGRRSPRSTASWPA